MMSGRISDIIEDKTKSNSFQPASKLSKDAWLVENKSPLVKRTSHQPAVADLENSTDDADSCSVIVAVRLRPFANREIEDASNRQVVFIDGCETTVKAPDSSQAHRFQFDFCFDSLDKNSPIFSDQRRVYEALAQPLLGRAFQGYNTCLFAYGQTGSGKSYSIMGHGDDEGIIPKFVDEMFNRIKLLKVNQQDLVAVNVETSFFEIYNEKIHDLLSPSQGINSNKQNLRVREHPEYGPYVEGLSLIPVSSFDDIQKLLSIGNRQRATASTGMNEKSSRSHSVFTIQLSQLKFTEFEGNRHEHSVVSKINLVDLAGSERQSSANTTGIRLKEGASINKSLLTLGKVISVLADSVSGQKKRKVFVPYRDSILTWLLKESLGGNARTSMLATISPSSLNIEETLSTLRYAQQARSIVNSVHVNEDPKIKLIRELRAEIDKLKAERGELPGQDFSTVQEIVDLRRALKEKEMDLEQKQLEWQQRLKRAEEKIKKESSALEYTGISVNPYVDNKQPTLVNLNEDPQLSEILLYVLHEGQTKIGRQGALKQNCDIQLAGALIADYHGLIINEKGCVSITAVGSDSPIFVNGQQINRTVYLQHGDRVVIGGDHYFRFSYPSSVESSSRISYGQLKDYAFAKNEIEMAQNQRLESERLKIKMEMEKQMEEQLKVAELNYNLKLKEQKQEYEDQLHKMMKQRTQSPSKLDLVPVPSADKLLSHLRAEKLRLTQEQERLKPKLKLAKGEEPAVKGLALVPTDNTLKLQVRAKTDLYKVALLIREANKLSQIKGMPTVYEQEEVDDVIIIKVTDAKSQRYALLTVAKFEERLTDMRDSLYTDESPEDSMIVFCNPTDVWRDSSQDKPLTLDEVLNSQGKITTLEQDIGSTSDPKTSSGSGNLFNFYRDFLMCSLKSHKDADGAVTCVYDRIIRHCELCRVAANNILSKSPVTQESQIAMDDITSACYLQLVVSSEALLELCQLPSNRSVEYDHLTKLRKVSFKVSHHAAQILQGLALSSESLLRESYDSLQSGLLELSELCGMLSVIENSPVSVNMAADFKLSAELQIACEKGAREQVMKKACETLETLQLHQEYMKDGQRVCYASGAIHDSISKLLTKLDIFLSDYVTFSKQSTDSMRTNIVCQNSDVGHNYESLFQAVACLRTINDSLASLTKPMFTQGKDYDRAIILKAADAIKRSCRKLASDRNMDIRPLAGSVSLLFSIMEAEGKVLIKHKAAAELPKKETPLETNSQKTSHTKRVLPPSPESVLHAGNSPPKSVQKLTAMFNKP